MGLGISLQKPMMEPSEQKPKKRIVIRGLCSTCRRERRWRRGGEVLIRAEMVAKKAAELGHEDCLKAALKAGANVNTDVKYFAALEKAAANGHYNCVDLLLKSGADVNHKDHINATALVQASSNGKCKCLDVLITAGADVNRQMITE